jgi:glycosyltransferase involved in cell wall biosynthesis
MPEPWKLVIVGDGPERGAIEAKVAELGMQGRVFLPGHAAEPAAVMGLFDLFALSSDSEQFPISVVEAMAAGLAVASTSVGDIPAMVSPPNKPFVRDIESAEDLMVAINTLAAHPEIRLPIGAANRAMAQAEYGEEAMVAAYRETYARALGRGAFP